MFRALDFAAKKHLHQKRKGLDRVPYINHVIEVTFLISKHCSEVDEATLVAATLHDTVEDTETTLEELEREFGSEVASLVAEVTDDKSLEKKVRKARQLEHAPKLSPRAKLIKLADKICNVHDMAFASPDWSVESRLNYVEWATRVVAGLRGVNAGLDSLFDETLRKAQRAIRADTHEPKSEA